jgi:hypothetical protein
VKAAVQARGGGGAPAGPQHWLWCAPTRPGSTHRAAGSQLRQGLRIGGEPEIHRIGATCATWCSAWSANPYERPELGPRSGPTLCAICTGSASEKDTKLAKKSGQFQLFTAAVFPQDCMCQLASFVPTYGRQTLSRYGRRTLSRYCRQTLSRCRRRAGGAASSGSRPRSPGSGRCSHGRVCH